MATATKPIPSSATASASRWLSAGTRRCPTSTPGSPRISAHNTKANSPNVVTLMPPAVLLRYHRR